MCSVCQAVWSLIIAYHGLQSEIVVITKLPGADKITLCWRHWNMCRAAVQSPGVLLVSCKYCLCCVSWAQLPQCISPACQPASVKVSDTAALVVWLGVWVSAHTVCEWPTTVCVKVWPLVWVTRWRMSYISVAEEEGGEPIELPAEDDGTGATLLFISVTITLHEYNICWDRIRILIIAFQATCFLEKKIHTKLVLTDQLSKYRTLQNNYTTANEILKNQKKKILSSAKALAPGILWGIFGLRNNLLLNPFNIWQGCKNIF